MALSTKYSPAETEDKWYQFWMDKGFFHGKPNPEKEPYCMVIPPPNVTGVLHMGHMLNNTVQDVLIRKARMEGKEACWVPGTDHASIATEARVVAMLREKGIKKSSLTRDEFLKYAWEWKEKYGGIILEQLKKLGASCDWDRTSFTMDPEYYKAVISVFVDLYNKGYIYRGMRMINWDCEARTALSNEEVLYQEGGERSVLYSIKYKIKDAADDWMVIATQRPETIMGDVAIAVNPTDERYLGLIGKNVLVPFINREIPVIADNYVDKAFGTGCLKVTPAHDVNDYEIGLRHNLPVIDTINDDGTLNEKCELPKFIGKDRFVVRKEIVRDLRETGHLLKEEEFVTRIGRSERTNSVVEPKLSLQWFVKMKEISVRAKDAVANDAIKLYPSKFKNTYAHWMDNVRDWCISRQLWWGHRIPAWYDEAGNFVVAENTEEAEKLYYSKFKIHNSSLTQDSDVLDTWASSWLWPIAVFDGFKDAYFIDGKIDRSKNPDLNYFYPTKVLVTAPEILFFWVARMIIAGYEYMDEKPFQDVYLTGVVRDKLGRKMSKSLGNSPDALELIVRYGADGVRTGMLFSSAAGNDLLFDEKLCEQGRNFANKIWNAFRLVKGWETSALVQPEENKIAIEWFESKINQSLIHLEDHFAKFRISDALHTLYKLTWDDFCAWYLEIIKPEFGKPIDQLTYHQTISFFESILKLLHPFMPFITEELWHELKERRAEDCIMVAPWLKPSNNSSEYFSEREKSILGFHLGQVRDNHIEAIKEGISFIRKTRQKQGFKNNELSEVYFYSGADKPGLCSVQIWKEIVEKLSNSTLFLVEEPVYPQGFSYDVEIVHGFHWNVKRKSENRHEQIKEILKEIEYNEVFLSSVMKKLSNEKFVSGAPPQVIDTERRKKADAETKIKSLNERLKSLG
jgi:valyl-tRNA synthetase